MVMILEQEASQDRSIPTRSCSDMLFEFLGQVSEFKYLFDGHHGSYSKIVSGVAGLW